MEQQKLLLVMAWPLWKTSGGFFKHTAIFWYNSCISRVFSKEMNIYVRRKPYTRKFTAALLIKSPLETTQMPSTGKWTNKSWSSHSAAFYSMVQRNELLKHFTHGGIVQTSWWVKGARHRKVHAVWFHLYDVQEPPENSGCSKLVCLRTNGGESWLERSREDILGWWKCPIFLLSCWLQGYILFVKSHQIIHISVHFTIWKFCLHTTYYILQM